jgi:hypothetical protein
MRTLFLSILLLFPAFYLEAQTVTSARFFIDNRHDGFRYIELMLDDDIMVVIDDNGLVEDVPDFEVAYYDHYDIHDPVGKIKSIGNLQFTYYNKFDIHDKFGSLKSIGDIKCEYYTGFDIHDPKGKVKSVGPGSVLNFV